MIYDYAIIGGGLAGLCCAIDLKQRGHHVLLVEKNAYPKHKVCGEYISNEVLHYLHSLGVEAPKYAVSIDQFHFTASNGAQVKRALGMGGFGWSRYAMDQHLYHRANELGVEVIQEELQSFEMEEKVQGVFRSGGAFQAQNIICAYGKRNRLDQGFSRDFARKRTPWIGVKAHYKGEHPANEVALHHFIGGYCGVSRVEEGKINVCYLIHERIFKQYKDLEEVKDKVLCQNPALKSFFDRSEMLFDRPLTISQIYFGDRSCHEGRIPFLGDSAGMIHPMAGNGMAMAIGSAQILCSIIGGQKKLTETLCATYDKQWNQRYASRVNMGRRLQRLLDHTRLTEFGMRILPSFPFILDAIVRRTHGEYI